MSAQLSRALGKRVTLVSEQNAKGQKNAKYKIAEKLEDLWHRVRDRYGLSDDMDFSIDTTKLLDFIQQQADTRKSFNDLYGKQREDVIAETAGEIINAVADMYSEKTGQKFSLDIEHSEKKVEMSAIRAIQSIGRKSINDFSAAEIVISEPFAKEWYKTMQEKSPFFRAWFGDWRAQDTKNSARVVLYTQGESREINSQKRTIKNHDTQFLINVDDTIINDSLHYAKLNKEVKQISQLLSKIDYVIKNAVLLDTQTSSKSSHNKKGSTSFIHYLYAPVSINGAPFMAKLEVEEYDQSIKHRAYNLQRIELSGLSRAQFSGMLSMNRGKYAYKSDALTVSQVYELVKKYDPKFTPGREVNPAFLNEDGTPKVFYHGTSETFDAFDRTKGRTNMDINGMFFSPYEIEAGGYGENVGQYYLSIRKPASEGLAYKVLNMFKGQNNAGVKAREYLEKLGYDGVVGYDEVIAFEPTQIKSATDNIGTFNKYDERYRYSLDTDAIREARQAFTVIDTAGIEDGLEALKNVKNVGSFALKDISRFLDAISNSSKDEEANKNLRNTLSAIFEKPHSEATGRYARGVERMQQRVLDIGAKAGVCNAKGRVFQK